MRRELETKTTVSPRNRHIKQMTTKRIIHVVRRSMVRGIARWPKTAFSNNVNSIRLSLKIISTPDITDRLPPLSMLFKR